MRAVQFRTSETLDFVVVGSGAAGGVVAKELAVAGFRVLVLEQGPYLREKDFAHDEVKYLRQRVLLNDWNKQHNTFRKSATPTWSPTTPKPSRTLASRAWPARVRLTRRVRSPTRSLRCP